MDLQTLINFTGGIVLTGLGWFAHELWAAMKELRNDVHRLEVVLPTQYIRRDEFTEGMKEIKDICRQIFDRLDNKADK